MGRPTKVPLNRKIAFFHEVCDDPTYREQLIPAVEHKFPEKREENEAHDDVFRSSRTRYDDVFRVMGNPPTPEGKYAFPKKFDDYDEEGYTFLSIGGKLPRIRSGPPVGELEAEDCGDSSTIAPEVGKPKECSSHSEASAAAGKAVDSSTKEDDSKHTKGEFTEEEQRIIKERYCHSSTKEASGAGKAVDCGGDSSTKEDDSIHSKGDGSLEFTEEDRRIIKERYSHSSTKEASGARKAVDSSTKEASGFAGKAVDCGRSDDNIFSKGDGSYSTEEEQRMIKEFHSHLNAVGPYDIEMKPPKCLNYPLIPLSLDFLELLKESKPVAYEKYFLGPAKFALQQINVKENRNYKFDGIVKFVNTPLQHVYVTFAGKEEIYTKGEMQSALTYDKATFQASVYTPYGFGYNSDDYELLEWKRKPDPPAASFI